MVIFLDSAATSSGPCALGEADPTSRLACRQTRPSTHGTRDMGSAGTAAALHPGAHQPILRGGSVLDHERHHVWSGKYASGAGGAAGRKLDQVGCTQQEKVKNFGGGHDF